MASKRKLEEKKKRAASRQDKFQHERAEQVACRMLGKTYRKPNNKFWKLKGTWEAGATDF